MERGGGGGVGGGLKTKGWSGVVVGMLYSALRFPKGGRTLCPCELTRICCVCSFTVPCGG